MNGYLLAEEGPLSGMIIAFEEGVDEKNEWVLGRDPDETDIILEDPMVSRRHVIVRLTPEGLVLENLSSVNPATQNGMVIDGEVLLKEGDIIQIGSTFFHFTETAPEAPPAPAAAEEEEEAAEDEKAPVSEESDHAQPPSELHFGTSPDTRWLLKVISGPNAGAEFSMERGATYLIGKDPNICDIVFQDLSVSRQHARLSVDDEDNVSVEDLGSRNGVIVNGELITDKQLVSSQDLISLGTTTFLVVDRSEARETIISPPAALPTVPKEEKKRPAEAARSRDWKELVIPKKHLIVAGTFALLLVVGVAATFALFNAEPVVATEMNESSKIEEVIKEYPTLRFSFNPSSGKLFLVGHVLTAVQKRELFYTLKQFPFIGQIQDNVVVDEFVWQNMNDLLQTNEEWIGVSIFGPEPGQFVLRGYLETLEDLEKLDDYMNIHFPYLDKLENHVVVENNLIKQIESTLLDKGYGAVTFKLSNGEVVFTGRVEEKKSKKFDHLLNEMRRIPGVRVVKNFVVTSTSDLSRINLSTRYAVTGYSKGDDDDFFVVINGRILGNGDVLDGMKITAVKDKSVFLEKDGMKYLIHYNLQ